MSLYCEDGAPADITPWTPMPVLKPREYRPPDPERDRCRNCRRVAWQHRTVADSSTSDEEAKQATRGGSP